MTRKEQFAWIVSGTALTAFIVLQFLPVWWIEPTTALNNPPVLSHIQWNAPETAAMMERACYTCHSNETRLPLYMQIAPLSWMAAQRVNDARTHLNFSEQQANQIDVEKIIESIQNGVMPPAPYLLLHPEARLSEGEKAELIAGIRATLSGIAREHTAKSDS